MTKLNEESLAEIRDAINQELTKRGFPSIEVEHETAIGKNHIEIKGEVFNTTPVLFKGCKIVNFGGSIEAEKVESNGREYLNIWVPVHVFYEQFGGGTNGVSLFSCNFRIFGTGHFVFKECR